MLNEVEVQTKRDWPRAINWGMGQWGSLNAFSLLLSVVEVFYNKKSKKIPFILAILESFWAPSLGWCCGVGVGWGPRDHSARGWGDLLCFVALALGGASSSSVPLPCFSGCGEDRCVAGRPWHSQRLGGNPFLFQLCCPNLAPSADSPRISSTDSGPVTNPCDFVLKGSLTFLNLGTDPV